jgi:hypothetical protein
MVSHPVLSTKELGHPGRPTSKSAAAQLPEVADFGDLEVSGGGPSSSPTQRDGHTSAEGVS